MSQCHRSLPAGSLDSSVSWRTTAGMMAQSAYPMDLTVQSANLEWLLRGCTVIMHFWPLILTACRMCSDNITTHKTFHLRPVHRIKRVSIKTIVSLVSNHLYKDKVIVEDSQAHSAPLGAQLHKSNHRKDNLISVEVHVGSWWTSTMHKDTGKFI